MVDGKTRINLIKKETRGGEACVRSRGVGKVSSVSHDYTQATNQGMYLNMPLGKYDQLASLIWCSPVHRSWYTTELSKLSQQFKAVS